MRAFLTRQRNGSYMLTRAKPVIMKVLPRCEHVDAFVPPGDPIGYRHMCREGVRLIFGDGIPTEPLQSVEVHVTGSVRDG